MHITILLSGIRIPYADAFSRLPLPTQPTIVQEPGELVNRIHQLSTSIITAQHINKDPLLSRVRRLVAAGWTVEDPDYNLEPFHHRRHELSIIDGCILWGSRVTVPKEGRELILQQLPECHPGMSRMKSLARGFVWWPKIDTEIDNLVKQCNTCQQDRPMPPRSLIHLWEYPKRPWQRIHIDHAGPFLGHTYLIITDAYSKWIEAKIVPSTSKEATIKILRSLFATHGIPEHIVSNNGKGFTSHDFEAFNRENGIRHSCTSPYPPSSSGLAERAVQTVKHGIAKMEGPIQCRLDRFLLHYRITPQTTTGESPAKFLMGRRLRTRLDLIHPDATDKIVQKQEKMANSDQKKERVFNKGDKVYAKNFTSQSGFQQQYKTKQDLFRTH